MPSKIQSRGYAEQVAAWLAEGKEQEWVARQLNEREALVEARGEKPARFTYQDVKRFKARLREKVALTTPVERAVRSWVQERDDALSIVQEAVDFVLAEPVQAEWDRDVRETIAAKLSVAREKLKILGAYPREGAQVGVQVNAGFDPALREMLWRALRGERPT